MTTKLLREARGPARSAKPVWGWRMDETRRWILDRKRLLIRIRPLLRMSKSLRTIRNSDSMTPNVPVDPAPSCGFLADVDIEHNDRDPAIVAAVDRAKRGDMDAFRFLYLRYKNNVYGYVLSIVRDEHDAEDATQHVFLKLMSVIPSYQPRKVPFTAWIIRVARNVAVDYQRNRRTIPCEEVFAPSAPLDDGGRDRRWGLAQALETLPDDQRDVVILRHLVGLTPAEIATHIGRSEASVHGLHHRGRENLQRELTNADCAPTTRLVA
jgi:RNA polymerase sigma-70 factor, ECF subfamily